jgi:hypothetical protein
VAAIAGLELGVLAFITLLWVANFDGIRRKEGPPEDQSLVEFLLDWCKNLEFWLTFFPDWIHLVLLVMVGFTMMEGAGHSNFFEWRCLLLFNFGVTYTYLTLSAILSSFLFQCAQFLSSRNRKAAPSLSKPASKNLSRKASTLSSPAEEFGNSVKEFWSDDWKYQRIFGQIGVLVLMAMYLLLVDDSLGQNMDSLASVIVGAIVVACIWSFAVATVVAIRSIRCLVTTFTKPKPKSKSTVNP